MIFSLHLLNNTFGAFLTSLLKWHLLVLFQNCPMRCFLGKIFFLWKSCLEKTYMVLSAFVFVVNKPSWNIHVKCFLLYKIWWHHSHLLPIQVYIEKLQPLPIILLSLWKDTTNHFVTSMSISTLQLVIIMKMYSNIPDQFYDIRFDSI